MELQNFLSQIEKSYHAVFPESHISVKYTHGLYADIWITCRLANDISEVANRIAGNDMLSIMFQIDKTSGELPRGMNPDSELPEDLILNVEQNSYHIKPPSQYLAYGTTKLPYRKTRGNGAKLVKTLDKYFNKLRESILQDLQEDLIHPSFVDIVKRKVK